MEIVLTNLTKKYKGCTAVNNVTMRITAPLIYGLVGKNGAGKTTLLKMIAGLTHPTSGRINCIGHNGIGTLIESPGMYGHLTARDNLLVKMKMIGDFNDKHADELLNKVGLNNTGKKKTSSFSLGMKQRLGIALALVGDPDILLLDEPINGLDPEGIVLIRDLLVDLKNENKIIIVSSHMLEELSKISDKYGILHEGVLVKEFQSDELVLEESDSFIAIVDNAEKATAVLTGLNIHYSTNGNCIFLFESEEKSCFAISKLFEAKIQVREFKRNGNALEKILLDKGGDIQ